MMAYSIPLPFDRLLFSLSSAAVVAGLLIQMMKMEKEREREKMMMMEVAFVVTVVVDVAVAEGRD
jgi:hypothetical protein